MALSQWLTAAPFALSGPGDSQQLAVDWSLFDGLLANLMPLLDDQKFDAIEHFDVLQAACVHTELTATLFDIGLQVKGLNFEEAARRLRQLGATRQPAGKD